MNIKNIYDCSYGLDWIGLRKLDQCPTLRGRIISPTASVSDVNDVAVGSQSTGTTTQVNAGRIG